ncbi:metallophosphoesterase [Rhizosphaericola mali]|uniref:Metallophosphoesterase n=1 Tax=Rhizosphaericola mali TaxID=2545455 RepID=A0A5P2GH33_9BACT|nr:metallophosphoesterase [Rhizosphaericola mali]QES91071.1 metallophosphoesterase [Rhizosphaericola mali]
MKIQYLSDLHLEFAHNFSFIEHNQLSVTGDILIMAGDIVTFGYFERLFTPYKSFFDFISTHYKAVYWLAGNHEYYHGDIAKRSGAFKEEVYPNIFLVNNVIEQFDGCRILFSTLWSKIEPANEEVVRKSMSDFSVISYAGKDFTPDLYNHLFDADIHFLQQSVQTAYEGSTIIVTHHVPTLLYYPVEYVGSPINNGFVTELKDFIEQSCIDYWIYGHHHRNTPTFKIGKAQLLTNQLGYVARNECPEFDAGAYIEV